MTAKMRLLTLTSIFVLGLAIPGSAQNVTETGASTSFAPSPVETSVPEASGSPDAPVPGQGEYPAVQSWCEGGDNATYCPGPVRPFYLHHHHGQCSETSETDAVGSCCKMFKLPRFSRIARSVIPATRPSDIRDFFTDIYQRHSQTRYAPP